MMNSYSSVCFEPINSASSGYVSSHFLAQLLHAEIDPPLYKFLQFPSVVDSNEPLSRTSPCDLLLQSSIRQVANVTQMLLQEISGL